MRISTRINENTMSYKIQSQNISGNMKKSLEKMINDSMFNEKSTEGFSVFFKGRTFSTYFFEIISHDYDSVESAFGFNSDELAEAEEYDMKFQEMLLRELSAVA